jgi:organic hydroperoxide reductase OsmC/OhrA
MPTKPKQHDYNTAITWTGNTGEGTSTYRSYGRQYDVQVSGKPVVPGSADPAFRGDPTRYNPEELLIASLSACHMLWYLHLAAVNDIVVTSYVDHAEGSMIEEVSGAGHFTDVTLRPEIRVRPGVDLEKAHALHHEAHVMCCSANSVNFPVAIEPVITIADE